MSNPKILFFTNLAPNPLEPNRGTFIKSVIKHISRYYNVTLISPLPWFPKLQIFKSYPQYFKYSQVPRMAWIDGIKAYYPKYFMFPKIGIFQAHMVYLATKRFVKMLHEKERYDLVSGHWLFPDGVVVSWIGKELQIPFVLTAHGCDVNRFLDFHFRKKLILSAVNSANLVTVVSKPLKEKLEGLGVPEKKVVYINNGVDMDMFTVRDKEVYRSKLDIDRAAKVVLFVGRLSEEKNVELLIHASTVLRKEFQMLAVMIVGDGNLRGEYEKLIKKLGVENVVSICGERPYSEIPDWLACADVICLPSKREGMPTIILESLAAGRPVVASRVGGIPDLVNGSNGFMFNSGDLEGLVMSLREALYMDWDAKTLRESVRKFSWDSVAEKFRNEFDLLIGSPPPNSSQYNR